MVHYLVKSRRKQTAQRSKGHRKRPNKPDYWGLSKHIKSLTEIAKEHGFSAALKKGLELQQYWRNAQGAQETHTEILMALGIIAVKEGKFKQAHQIFDSVLEQKPNSTVAMVGKVDVLLMEGDYVEAREWSQKAYNTSPNKFTALKHVGVLYALKDFDSLNDVLKPYITDALGEEDPKSEDKVFLAMNLAVNRKQHDVTWVDFYSKHTAFGNKEKIIRQLINARDKFREIHQPKEGLDENEMAILGKDKEKARIAHKIISAYGSAGFVWDTLHERIAASNQIAKSASTMGFVSRHQSPKPQVAAGPVKHIKLN